MKSLLIFIPKQFCRTKHGYMFGNVTYDVSTDVRKFYVVGVRKVESDDAVQSKNNIIGYFSGSDNVCRRSDKALSDSINVYLHSTNVSNTNNHEYRLGDIIIDSQKVVPSAYHIVIIVYDQTIFLETELLTNKSTFGDHFYELKELLQEKQIENELKKKSNFTRIKEILLSCMFFFLYQIQFVYKITNVLLPILKYSTLGLHLNEWLKNIIWTFATVIHNKRFTLKTGNHVLAMALDMLLGTLLLQFILHSIGNIPPSQILLDNAEKVVESLKDLVNWLMGAPAGLKLNHSFNKMLGKFFLYHIHLWWTFLIFMKPVLDFAFRVLLLFGKLGITFQISIAADLLALVSFHSYCIYVYAARLFNIQANALTALFRLFLGKKMNPLRSRVDSCQYQPDQLFVGTLLFSILLFLMPTTWVYYSVFTTLRLMLIGLGGFLTRLKFYLRVVPIYTFFKWYLHSPATSSSVNMKMHIRHTEGPTTLIVSTVVSTWSDTWKRCIPDTISCYPSIEWTTIINNIFWGQLLYPL